jgi:hypothetical protein
MQPAAANIARLPMPGVTQPNGAITAPSRSVPTNCEVAITMSEVARSIRVIRSSTEKHRLPASAIIAGPLKLCADGLSAITTPAKPIKIALQRRQPTCSRRTIADSAVTKIGHAR